MDSYKEFELSGISDLIFSDRYALKDPERNFQRGDKVVVLIDTQGTWEKRGVGRILDLSDDNMMARIKLNDTGEVIERNVSALDRPLEEEPSAMWDRVSYWLAAKTEEEHLVDSVAKDFRWALDSFKLSPGGRINSSIGSEILSLEKYPPDVDKKEVEGLNITSLNCFVLPIEPDDKSFGKDSRNAIMDTAKNIVNVMSQGGGVGTNLSPLRPSNARVRKVNGRSSGAVSWGAMYSFNTGLVSQGGCIHQDSNVLTDRGMMTADELYVALEQGEVIKGWTHKGWRTFTDFFDNGVKEVFEVKTDCFNSSGDLLRVTADHKVLVYDDKDFNKLMPLKDVSVGDRLVSLDTSELKTLVGSKIEEIRSIGEHQVYDFTVEDTHMYWVDGFYVSNSRRGALLLALDISHPDIVEFIFSKVKKEEIPEIEKKWGPKFPNSNFKAHGIENANISVAISDDFMDAVKNDGDWDLIFPDYDSVSSEVYNSEWDGMIKNWIKKGHPVKVYDTVKARDLWDCIMEGAWRSAEPGVIFLERYNKLSNTWYFNDIICTNPCLYKDTYMVTNNGLEKISELKSKVWNGVEFKDSKSWTTGVKPVVKITTNSGFEFITTPDHRFLLDNGEWCEAQDLLNKHIMMDLSEKEWVGNDPYPEINYKTLGFILGDGGWNTKNKVMSTVYTNTQKDQEVRDLISDVLNVEFKVSSNKLCATIPLNTIYSDALQGRIKDRIVPDWIMQLPKQQMKDFIIGLFSANGTNLAKYRKIQLVSINKAMLQQVQQMLGLFGIKAKLWVHCKKHDVEFYNGLYECKESYHLVLSRKSYQKYMKEFGFIQTYKNAFEDTFYKEELNDKVISIEEHGEAEVWDFNESSLNRGVVNSVFVHNCGK